MTKTRLWFMIAGIFIASGLVIGFIGALLLGFDFSKLNTAGKLENNTYFVEDSFTGISIDVATADVSFEVAKDGKVRVECAELENLKHNVTVENGTLVITYKDDRKWYEKIHFFSFGRDEKIVIYLPQAEDKEEKGYDFRLSDLKIDVSTGDVKIDRMYVEKALSINASTGDLNLNNVTAGSLHAEVSTGDIRMKAVRVLGELKIDSSTGDVRFEDGDAETVRIDTSTGDIRVSFLTEKDIQADSSTGKVSVPDNHTGGKCVLDTSTGDIIVTYSK